PQPAPALRPSKNARSAPVFPTIHTSNDCARPPDRRIPDLLDRRSSTRPPAQPTHQTRSATPHTASFCEATTPAPAPEATENTQPPPPELRSARDARDFVNTPQASPDTDFSPSNLAANCAGYELPPTDRQSVDSAPDADSNPANHAQTAHPASPDYRCIHPAERHNSARFPPSP